MTILSIDSWASFEPKSWDWNNWYKVGEAPDDLAEKTTRVILAWLRTEGYLTDSSKGKLTIEDDGYNIVIVTISTRRPIFALEYGSND